MLSPSSLNELYDKFARFESHLEGFKIDGVPAWEAVRARVFANCAVSANLFYVGHPFVPRSLSNILRTGTNVIRSMTTQSVRRLPETDVLILGHSRLVKNQEGKYQDPYSEAYFNSKGLNVVFLERAFRCQHFYPRVAGHQAWIDNMLLRSRRTRQLKGASLDKVNELDNLIQKEMGFACDLVKEIENVLGTREIQLPFYDKLIQRIKPKVAIVIVAYTSPFFVEACKLNQIPVIEIQHGMISKYHMGYDYSVLTPQLYFPDHVWLWGEYWKASATMPGSSQYAQVGWPVFERQRQKTQQNKFPGCLFISQGAIGKTIAKSAMQLRLDRPEINVYYKLHPSEYQTWQHDYADLTKAGIRVLGANDGDIYQWLAQIKYVIGGYSTVLAEAIGMGCRVGVLNVPGAEYMERLVSLKAAHHITDDWNEFFKGADTYDPAVAMNVFSPFNYEHIETLLQKII